MPKYIERIGGADLSSNPYYQNVKWIGNPANRYGTSYYQCTYWGYQRTQEIAEIRCTYLTGVGETRDICPKPMFKGSGFANAKDWYKNAIWDKTTKASEVRVGDIVCYGSSWGGGAGHVRIVERIEGNYMILSGANENYKGGVKFGIRVPITEGGGENASGLQGYIHNPFITFDEKPQEDSYKAKYEALRTEYDLYRQTVNSRVKEARKLLESVEG